MRFRFAVVVVTGTIVSLAGCGGGGDSADGAETRVASTGHISVDADAVLTRVLAGAALDGLRAKDGAGTTFTASLAYTALPDGFVSGAPARRSLQTTSVGRAGDAPDVVNTTLVYRTSPARLLVTSSAAGTTTVFDQGFDLPLFGIVGQSGVFAQGLVYASAQLGTPVGSETLSWSIEADGATTALACLTSVYRVQGSVSSEKDCFRVDGAGKLLGGTIVVERPGLALHFR